MPNRVEVDAMGDDAVAGDPGVAQRDDGVDVVVVNEMLQAEQGDLAAAIKDAFLDDVEVVRFGLQ